MISSVLGFSQHSKTIDSLQLLISKQKGIKRAQTLNELSWQYAKKNDSLAIAYAQQARKCSDSLGYTAELATSYIRLGTVYLHTNRFKEAEENLKIALQLEEKENNISGIARAKGILAVVYKKTQNYSKAIQLNKECLIIQKQQQNNKKIARLYNNLGFLYKEKNEPEKALEYYHKSIDLRDSIQDKKGLLISYKNIGAFYNDQKKYRQAIIELKKGIELCKELNDSIQLSGIFMNIGSSHNHLRELDTALVYFEKSLFIKEKNKIKKTETIYSNIGSIMEKKQRLDKAITYYDKSIAIAIQNKNERQLVDTYYNKGKVYKKKEQYNKALAYYFDALQLAEKYHKEYRRLDILSGIGEAYEQLQDYRNAHIYNEKHIILRNQIEKKARENEQAIQMLNEERHKNKLLQIEKQKTEAESKTKNTQLTFLLIGSALMVILFFVLFRSYRLKKQNQIAIQNEKIKQGEIEELLKNQELKSIHAMIDGQEKERKRIAQDLHDRLGSMLSVVKIHYKSVEENLEKMKADSKTQYEKANELLDEACVAVREISHNMVSGVLTKFGLIPALRELKQNLESTGTLEIELIDYGFDDRIDNELEINIYRIIQELIGNILKHANAKEVSVQLLKRETTINITVIDDGDGFDTTAIANYSGMGIKGIQSRVENLQGEVAFDSGRGNGTTVTIDIPVDPKKHTL
ncbi:tetratricopeptide repeat protein [Aquimarina aquimarini]|nr:tetratricopeptide repeat protein [Aquimarina aquimarini]